MHIKRAECAQITIIQYNSEIDGNVFLTNALLVGLKMNTPVIYRSTTVHSHTKITEKTVAHTNTTHMHAHAHRHDGLLAHYLPRDVSHQYGLMVQE